MSRPKSDAQLDAEAAAPLVDMGALITLHREAYLADLYIPRLVTHQPPTTLDLQTAVLDEEPAAAIGMTISGLLLRRLGSPADYGAAFPWAKAYWLLRSWCRRNHAEHRGAERPYWRGALCYQSVRLTVIEEWSVLNTATVLRHDELEPVLRDAFGFIERSIDRARQLAEKREHEDAGLFYVGEDIEPHRHRPLGGMHLEDCPQCVKEIA